MSKNVLTITLILVFLNILTDSVISCVFLYRENILVLDIFFEALNYEKIEQKKAYEVAGLLGETFYEWKNTFNWLKSPYNTLIIINIYYYLLFNLPLSGDIGGQMGLFIGASVLTILEIFDYLYEVNCISVLFLYDQCIHIQTP